MSEKSKQEGNVSPKRSTICSVCKVDSGNYNMNYGANSCLSCRAFFRRVIQGDKAKTFVCVTGGSCQISEKSRRQCQRCRYDRCLQSGMQKQRVLDEQQFQTRFQKMISKKRKTINMQHNTRSSSEESEDLPAATLFHSTQTYSLSQFNEEWMTDNNSATTSSSNDANMLDTWKKCKANWVQMLNKENNPQFGKNISLYERREKLAELFMMFSESFAEFHSLPAETKRNLLQQNSPIFEHYIIAQAIISMNKKTLWLYLGEDLTDEAETEIDLTGISEDYLKLAESFPGQSFLTLKGSALLAAMILFQGTDFNSHLQQCADWANQIFGSPSSEDLGCVMDAASVLASNFSASRQPDYLNDWSEQEILRFNSTCGAVNCGEEILGEYVRFQSFDEPPSKRFIPDIIEVFTRRFRMFFTAKEENLYSALALTAVRLERNVDLGCTAADLREKSNLLSRITSSSRKISIRQVNAVTELMEQDQLELYMKLVAKLKFLVEDDRIYKLGILGLLSRPRDVSKNYFQLTEIYQEENFKDLNALGEILKSFM